MNKSIKREQQRLEFFESQLVKYQDRIVDDDDDVYVKQIEGYIKEHILVQIQVSVDKLRKLIERDEQRQKRKLNINVRDYSRWRPVRLEAINRDGHCVRCGSSDKLEGHHIHNFADYPEQRYDVDNVGVLCHDCHVEFHSKHGKHQNNQEQFDNFIC